MAETSKTADQALTVLLELVDEGPLSAAELSRRLAMNRTVVHRLLATLHARGFVSRHARGYAPGAVLVRIAERVQPELRAAAAGVMATLSGDIGETVVLHVADGDDAVVIEQHAATQHIVRVQHETGSRHPLALGASGRALLAFMAAPTVERVAKKAERPTLLRQQLQAVRQMGYALSHDELQQGVDGLAVPVFGQDRHALASLAVIVPTTRVRNLLEYLEPLQEAALQVSGSLYGDHPADGDTAAPRGA